MIVASMCTIPQRKRSFLQVLQAILGGQELAVDHVRVWLNGYKSIDGDLPKDRRLTYCLQPDNPGPGVRYRIADELRCDDVLIILDDDLAYPSDYVKRSVEAVTTQGEGGVVCFGGLRWDPITDEFSYNKSRHLYALTAYLSEPEQIAVLMPGVSAFSADTAKVVANSYLPGFGTNDDFMVSLVLQQNRMPIACIPKHDGWIQDYEESSASHALYLSNVQSRHNAFGRLVCDFGFEPTAGRLNKYLSSPERVLVASDICPPLRGSEQLDQFLIGLCAPERSVHLIAPVPWAKASSVERHVNAPYNLHPVAVAEKGGRLDWFSPVRSWRDGRVEQSYIRLFQEQAKLALKKLRPTHIEWFGSSSPPWFEQIRSSDL
jgi:hypothetical protein